MSALPSTETNQASIRTSSSRAPAFEHDFGLVFYVYAAQHPALNHLFNDACQCLTFSNHRMPSAVHPARRHHSMRPTAQWKGMAQASVPSHVAWATTAH